MRAVCLLALLVVGAAAAPACAATVSQRAVQIAARSEAARALPSSSRPRATLVEGDQWLVTWYRARQPVLAVDVSISRRAVLAVWHGDQVDYPMARGYPGWFGGKVNALWFWLPLCVLFVAPFVDPRRPFRILHLDLVAIVGLSVSLAFFNAGRTAWSVPLVYPSLIYLLWRALVLLRRPGESAEHLVPFASRRLLVVGLVLALVARAALNVADTGDRTYVGYGTLNTHVVDVGIAGVLGADRILHGEQLYTRGGQHLDTYGPLNYLAYVPFELVWPYGGSGELTAAHAAALTFDLAAVALLFMAGVRLRAGPAGRDLGVALAFGWAACPWTAYVLMSNTDDALVGACVAGCLALWTVPIVRGAFVGAGTAVKFAPVVLLPSALAGGRRAALLALAAFAAVVLITTVPLLPDGGWREFYDTTIGYQLGTPSVFSVWGRWHGIAWLHTLVKAGAVAVALGAGVAVIRSVPSVRVAAAAAAAALLAAEIAGMHWIYFYFVWALPALLIALFARCSTGDAAS